MSIFSRYTDFYDVEVPCNVPVTYLRDWETHVNPQELPLTRPRILGQYTLTSFCIYFCGHWYSGKRVKTDTKLVCVYTFSDLVKELRGVHDDRLWEFEDDFGTGISECQEVNKVVQNGTVFGMPLQHQEVVTNAILADYEFHKVQPAKLAASQVVNWLKAQREGGL
jgi:hypothetical protein